MGTRWNSLSDVDMRPVNVLEVLRDEATPLLGRGGVYADSANLSERYGLQGVSVRIERLRPGHSASAPHWHSSLEEGLYVLQGSLVLECGDEERIVRAGHFVALPSGPPSHVFRNASDVEATYLTFAAGAGDEVTYT